MRTRATPNEHAQRKKHHGRDTDRMDLIVGSDTYTDLKQGGLGRGRLFQPSTRLPTGELHAVDRGQRAALCGHTPAYVFADQPWRPENNLGVHPCPDCLTAAAGPS